MKKIELRTRIAATTREQLRELRKAATGKNPLWLADLADSRLAEIYHRLMFGQTAAYIARVVQEKWHVRNDMKQSVMEQGIKDFRKKVIPEITQLKADVKGVKGTPAVRSNIAKRAKRINEKLDGMKEMTKLIQLQMSRHVRLLKKEKEENTTDRHITRSAEVLSNMLNSFVDKQMKLGILDAKPNQLNVEVKSRFELLLGKLDDGGAKMLNMTHSFLDMAEPQCVVLEELSDGTFALKEAECSETS